jgi:hypothetical protein
MGQEFGFNPMQYDPQAALDVMPAGWYKAVVSATDLRQNADKTGIILELSWKIVDGPFAGRVVKKTYNRTNPSQQAVDISNRELTSIAGCMNLWNGVQNTDQLCNIPMQIKLTTKKDSDYNDVKGYKDINGNDPVKPGAGAAPMSTGAPYAAPAMPPPAAPAYQTPPPGAVQPLPPDLTAHWQRSPDGAWKLNPATNAWEPNSAPQPPAPPAPPAAPAAPETISAVRSLSLIGNSWPRTQLIAPQAPAPPAGAPPAAPPAWTPGATAPQPPVWKP